MGKRRGGLRSRAAGGACASGRIAVRWTTSALYVSEVPRPETDFDEAHTELCSRHIHAFGPTMPGAFAWWAGLPPQDARQVWTRLAGELLPVDFCGQKAWILAEDEPLLRSPPPLPDARLLVTPDLRLLGQDRTGRFVGPGLKRHTPT
jgi:Winged helix DNA-binding domain